MSIEPFTASYTADQVNDIIESLAAFEIRKQKIALPDNPNPGESE